MDEIFYSNDFPVLTEPTINETKWAFTADTYENGVTYDIIILVKSTRMINVNSNFKIILRLLRDQQLYQMNQMGV